MADIDLELNAEIKDALSNIEKFAKSGVAAFEKISDAQKNVQKDSKKFASAAKSSFSSITDSIFSVQTAVAGLGAFIAGRVILDGINSIAGAIGTVTDAAAVQEDAVNQLNTALRLTGEFTEQASQEFQNFASQLQANTKIGDEVTLSQLALAKSFGATNEQAKDLVTAAADLSAATGISLDSAVRNLGKTFGGLTGELGEVVPELKNLSTEALQSGEAIDFILGRFGGAAAAEINTFSGATQQLANTFGDLQEEIGFAINQNPAVIASVKTLTALFQEVGAVFKENRDDASGFIEGALEAIVTSVPEVIRAFASLSDAAKTGVTAIFFIGDAIGTVFDKVGSVITLFATAGVNAFDTVKVAVLAFVSTALDGLNLIGAVSDETAQQFNADFQNAQRELAGSTAALTENFKDLFTIEDPDTSALESVLSGIDAVSEGALKAADAADKAVANFSDFKDAAGQGIDINIKGGNVLGDKVSAELQKLADEAAEFAKEVDKAGLTAAEAQKFDIGQKLAEQLKKIEDFETKKAISTENAESLRVRAVEAANEQILAIDTAAAEEAARIAEETNRKILEDQRRSQEEQLNAIKEFASSAGQAISDITQAVLGIGTSILNGITSITDDVNQNIQSVGSTLSSAISPILDQLVPGLGGIAGALIGVLSQPPDALAKQLAGFVDAIPALITRLAENIPTLLTALVNGFINEILVAIPDIINQLTDIVPGLLVALVDAIADPKFLDALIRASIGFTKAILAVLPEITNTLLEALPTIILVLAEEIPSLVIAIGNALGGIILAIIDNIDEVIIALIDALPVFVDALIEALPEISAEFIKALIFAVPLLIQALILALPRVISALSLALVQIVSSIGGAIAASAKEFGPEIRDSILEGLREGIQRIFDEISSPFEDITGGGGGPIEAVSNVVSSVGSVIGLQSGGTVPEGFPNDTFPAALSSGEIVIPRNDTERLSDFLDTADNNAQIQLLSQIASLLANPTEVATSINIDGQSLADVILELDRNNARLTA